MERGWPYVLFQLTDAFALLSAHGYVAMLRIPVKSVRAKFAKLTVSGHSAIVPTCATSKESVE